MFSGVENYTFDYIPMLLYYVLHFKRNVCYMFSERLILFLCTYAFVHFSFIIIYLMAYVKKNTLGCIDNNIIFCMHIALSKSKRRSRLTVCWQWLWMRCPGRWEFLRLKTMTDISWVFETIEPAINIIIINLDIEHNNYRSRFFGPDLAIDIILLHFHTHLWVSRGVRERSRSRSRPIHTRRVVWALTMTASSRPCRRVWQPNREDACNLQDPCVRVHGRVVSLGGGQGQGEERRIQLT